MTDHEILCGLANASRRRNGGEKCSSYIAAFVTPSSANNIRLAANVATGGNKSQWIKRELDRAARRVLARH